MKRIAEGMVDFKSEEGIEAEVMLSWFSIERYRHSSRSSSHPETVPKGRLVETDRKRDFYILIQTGKQFVSSFESHRAEIACARIAYTVIFCDFQGTSVILHGGEELQLSLRKSFRRNLRGTTFWTLCSIQWKRGIICLIKYSIKENYIRKQCNIYYISDYFFQNIFSLYNNQSCSCNKKTFYSLHCTEISLIN